MFYHGLGISITKNCLHDLLQLWPIVTLHSFYLTELLLIDCKLTSFFSAPIFMYLFHG